MTAVTPPGRHLPPGRATRAPMTQGPEKWGDPTMPHMTGWRACWAER